MTVAAILAEKGRDVVTIEPGTSVAQALATLAEHGIGAIIVAESGKIRGILSERDVVRAVARHGAAVLDREVRAIMTTAVVTCKEEDTINQVMAQMTRGRFRHLPVTDGDRLVGIVSIGDVVKRRIGDVEREAEEMRAYIATAS